MADTQRIYLFEPSEKTIEDATGVLPEEIWYGSSQYGSLTHASASQNHLNDVGTTPVVQRYDSDYGLGKVIKFAKESTQVVQALSQDVARPSLGNAFACYWVGAVVEFGSAGFFDTVRSFFGPGWQFQILTSELRFIATDNISLVRSRVTGIDPFDKKLSMLGVYRPSADDTELFTSLGNNVAPEAPSSLTTLDPIDDTRLCLGNVCKVPASTPPQAPIAPLGVEYEFSLMIYWQHADVENFSQETFDNLQTIIDF